MTIGGFVTEDSDEEGEASDVPQTNGAVALESVKSPAQPPLAHSPVPPTVQDPHLTSADQTFSSTLSVPAPANGTSTPSQAHTAVSAPADDSRAGAVSSTPVQSQGASAVSVPKTRLPNDIVGIYEDRIAEDPKGDVDAWTGLIAHLRSKGKYDEVRKVYSRFFDVFPTAVSSDHI